MGERIKLPNDPQSPEFWQAVRQAQGIVGPVATDTIGALIDAYDRGVAEPSAKACRQHQGTI